MKLYTFQPSGNCYKVRLLLAQLGLEYKAIELNPFKPETFPPEFLSINPAGKVPVLGLDSGEVLLESSAMLCYLAEGSDFYSDDRLKRAQILRWLFFEQFSIAPNIGPVRVWIKMFKQADRYAEVIKFKRQKAYAALEVIEKQLSLPQNPFLVGNQYTIADMAMFAYINLAPQGDFDLSPYPAINRWLERIKTQPGYIDISAAN
ncbi:Glutathione S-transferase domain protein [Thalassoporum mexicanum PCC 7367]|uniref:glutathione S-transferase family protein n=1 Tax=Thalassoporum mexicanum TaxID=3457544 RepID=UPI00029FFC29|nr:glutathione S-transferase family protein [Pseudanabaena sp. PCC 7367]AFY71240.1 Glutathione S-transferase domain protein [Pseudanabaena sp. PCC 7367]